MATLSNHSSLVSSVPENLSSVVESHAPVMAAHLIRFNFWRGPFHEGGMECSFTVMPCLSICCSGGPDTVAVCVDVDRLISGEGASKHVCCIDLCGVKGGSHYSGIPDGESASLNSFHEGPEFVVDGVGESCDCWEEFRAKSLFHQFKAGPNVWDRPADVLPFGAQAGDQASVGSVWESGRNGHKPLNPQDPSLRSVNGSIHLVYWK